MSDDTQEKADFRIDYDGTWYHDGAPIKRDALAKLFSDRALKVDEDGNYWLQTPFEKYPVEVEDVPFVIVDFEEENETTVFKTNMGEAVLLDKDHPLELRDNIPYIEVRDGLYARLARSVYYNLVHAHGESIQSAGEIFALGEADA